MRSCRRSVPCGFPVADQQLLLREFNQARRSAGRRQLLHSRVGPLKVSPVRLPVFRHIPVVITFTGIELLRKLRESADLDFASRAGLIDLRPLAKLDRANPRSARDPLEERTIALRTFPAPFSNAGALLHIVGVYCK